MKLKKAVKLARQINALRLTDFIGIAVDEDMDIYAYTSKPKTRPGGQWAGGMLDYGMKVTFVGVYSGNKSWEKTWRKL